MRRLLLILFLLNAIQSHAQQSPLPTVLDYITQQQYKEALTAVQSGAAVVEDDLPALLEYNSRTQLLREKPAGYGVILALMDSLLVRLKYFNGTATFCTPLGHAIANGDSAMVRILLAKGVKTGAENIVHIGYDLNAFQYAAFKYPSRPYPAAGLAILKMLQAARADVAATTLIPFQTHITHVNNVSLPADVNALDIALASGAPQEVTNYLRGIGLKETAKK